MAETRSTLLEVKQYYGRVQNYINGEWVDSSTDNWLDDCTLGRSEERRVQ